MGIGAHNLALVCDFRRSMNAVAAGTGDTQTGTTIDMLGWDGVAFVFAFGTITATAVTTAKVQQGNLSDGSDAADLAGSAQSVTPTTDNNKIVVSDIFQPSKRYVRPAVVRATANAVIDGVFAILYRGLVTPKGTAHSTLVRLAEVFNSPAEGTA